MLNVVVSKVEVESGIYLAARARRVCITHGSPTQVVGVDSLSDPRGAKHRSGGGSGDRNQVLAEPSQATPDIVGRRVSITTTTTKVEWYNSP